MIVVPAGVKSARGARPNGHGQRSRRACDAHPETPEGPLLGGVMKRERTGYAAKPAQ
jgi:hypothetical protein